MKTLIIVDVQNDFLPGGALAVQSGDQIIPIINQILPKFDHVFASQDWHPLHHVSFAKTHNKQVGEVLKDSGQILWPVHCVQHTNGAELSPQLKTGAIEAVFQKGVDLNIDSYSAFFDNEHKKSTGLAEHLKKLKLKDLYFAGLATDYCVLYSVLDALNLGFNAFVIQDACRAVNAKEGIRAIEKMGSFGAKVILSEIVS